MAPLMSLCLFFFFSFILAAPLDTRTVYAPPITNPTSSSVWTVGEVETVTWNATGIPAGVTGQIQLGYLTPGNEHLSVILASGFNLTDEKVNVTVPAVVSRTNYIVVLFGDSGNISPTFTIQGSTSASSASTGTSLTLTGTDVIASTGTSSSKSGAVSVTPSPPIATASSLSTATAPPSSPTGSGSTSSSVPTSASAVASPSPSPSTNAGWSMKSSKIYHLLMAPAALMLLL